MRDSYLRFDVVFYLLLGIGAYWAWTTSTALTPAFWPSTPVPQLQRNFVLNLLGHVSALVLLSLLAPKIAPFSERRLCTVAAPILIAASLALMIVGYGDPTLAALPPLASFLTGAAMAAMLFLWAETLLLLRSVDLQHLVIEGSVIAGLLMTVVVLCLPVVLGLALTAVLPFAMAGCTVRARCGIQAHFAEDADGKAGDAPGPAAGKAESKGARRSFARLALCCFVLALPAGMYQSAEAAIPSAGATDEGRTLFACTCTFVALAVIIDHRLVRGNLNHLFSRLIVPLMAGGMLIVSVVGSGLAAWGGYLMQTGYQLFLVYIYTEFARSADTRPACPVRVFGWGTLLIDLGLFAGFALLSYTTLFHTGWVQGAMLATVYLLLLVGVLVFPSVIEHVNLRSARLASVVVMEPDREGPPPAVRVAGREDDIGAFSEVHGLSAREREILRHLVRGRTLPSVATETCLSYNTVKTHVSHIYQKVGVHTRDELLDALEHDKGTPLP